MKPIQAAVVVIYHPKNREFPQVYPDEVCCFYFNLFLMSCLISETSYRDEKKRGVVIPQAVRPVKAALEHNHL
jgi:hypothetical protein